MNRKSGFVLIALAGIFFGSLAGVFFSLFHDLPQINTLKQFKPATVTTVYSRDNQILSRFYLERRFPISIEKIPSHFIDAILTIEDKYFYTHSGVNLKSILRAIVLDVIARKYKQGASTITQQLTKTLFLTPEKSIIRKIKEAILTLQIERRYTKSEILELYLNQIYLGSGAYGVEAAARTYFGKSIENVSLWEAALIAGLPKAPSTYSPLNHTALSKKRRNLVLKMMVQNDKISSDEYQNAISKRIILYDKQQLSNEVGFFIDYIKQNLKDQLSNGQKYSTGLNIYTTLDLNLQTLASKSIRLHMELLGNRMKEKGEDPSSSQCALVAIDIQTGGILSMIGGKTYSRTKFNRVTQSKRQPGSAFKPFVYAVALNEGFSQNRIILDAPLSYRIDSHQTWKINNFSNTYSGEMTLRSALALSKNTPAVRLLEMLTPEKIIDFARKAGISSKLSPTLSLALGTSEVNLLELTSAYIPFANLGIKVTPYPITKITDAESRIIFKGSINKQSIMSRQNAAIMSDMLKAVIFEGTGKKARVIRKDIGGKTGTTDSNKDALFIGFSPDIAVGVWVGNDNAKSLGKFETGAKAALPIWIDFMQHALANRPYQYFDIPDGTKMVYTNSKTGKFEKTKTPQSVKTLLKIKGL